MGHPLVAGRVGMPADSGRPLADGPSLTASDFLFIMSLTSFSLEASSSSSIIASIIILGASDFDFFVAHFFFVNVRFSSILSEDGIPPLFIGIAAHFII